jgi:hypothetical protein
MGLFFSCLNLDYSDTEIDYDDYIFNHQEILSIRVSEFLSRNIKKGDYIVLEINIDGKCSQLTCLVKKVQKRKINVILLTPLLNARKLSFVKKYEKI